MHPERECLRKLINSYQTGTLNLICGRPGMGKTTLAINMALAANAPMAVFDLGQKWQYSYCHLPAQRIHIDRTPYQTADDIREKVLQIQKTMPVRWVIIDWLQVVHPGQAIDENAKKLKAMAVELQVIVIALSGVRRSAEQRENKKPILQDTREWELIEPWVDDVRILYRPDYYRIEEDEYGSIHDVCYIIFSPPSAIKGIWAIYGCLGKIFSNLPDGMGRKISPIPTFSGRSLSAWRRRLCG